MNAAVRASMYGLFWLGYVALLTTLPTLFPPDPSLPNVAAKSGYNLEVAYVAIAAWSTVGLLFFAFAARKVRVRPLLGSADTAEITGPLPISPRRGWFECVVVGFLFSF